MRPFLIAVAPEMRFAAVNGLWSRRSAWFGLVAFDVAGVSPGGEFGRVVAVDSPHNRVN